MKKYDIFTVVKDFKFFTFSLIVCSIFLLAGCWGSSTDSSKVVVINVLDPDYHQDCHITGSINIPFEHIEERMKTLNKKDHYVLYCSNYACTAAPFAAQMLKASGFEDVGIFPGGIVQWYQKGYPCTGEAQKDYLKEENEPLSDEDHAEVKIISGDELKKALKL
jgi:rhodanese-related sulfurtransferase